MFNAAIEAYFRCFKKFLFNWLILLRWNRRVMLFNNNSFHFKARRTVERNWNNLIDFRFDYHDEIASFLKLHFHDVNEIEKQNSLNTDSCSIEFFLNLFCSFNWLILICVLVHYFEWSFNFLLLCSFLKSFEIRVHAFLFLIFKMLFFIARRRQTVAIFSSFLMISYALNLLITCRMI